MIDIAVIGAGPAGLSAAINAAARNVKPIVFGKTPETSAIWKAEKINNHLGMPNLSGQSMMETFLRHAADLDIEIRKGRIMQIIPLDGYYMLNFENEIIESKVVILSLGMEKSGNVNGEQEFLGKGVSYCATCDGMLYRGKDVVVVAESDEAVEDANFLAEICNKVYFISDTTFQQKWAGHLNTNIVNLNGSILSVLGSENAEKIVLNDGSEIAADGFFFIKQTVPLNDLISGLETVDGAVKVNRMMETSLRGVFACGDITGAPYQLSKATGEGQVAGQSAVKFLHGLG